MNQDWLIDSYNLYKDYLKDVSKSTLIDYKTYVGRKNNISGKLKNEFHLEGKYYFDLGQKYNKDFEELFDEYFLIDNKRIYVIECPVGIFVHYHFSIFDIIYYDLELKNNKLYYKSKFINKKVLSDLIKYCSNIYSKNYDGVLEIFENNKQLILF